MIGGLLAARPAAASQPVPYRVLVIHAADFYNPGANAQDLAMRAVVAARADRPVEFHAEALDAASFEIATLEPEIIALLRKKHTRAPIDVVVPLADAALRFTEAHRAELWPNAPIVFMSVGPDTLRDRPRVPNATGLTLEFDEKGTFELALRLLPQARRAVFVTGASEYDRYWVPRLEAIASAAAGRVEVTFLTGRPLVEVLDAVARLPPDSFVLYTTMFRDGNGLLLLPRNVAGQIAKASRVPVFGFAETYIGTGIVGGSISSFEAHGRRAGELVLRVLHGEKPDDIAPEPPPSPIPIVDARALQTWRIPESRLPPGTDERNREATLWERARYYVLAAGLVLATQTALIVALLAQSRRRRRAELLAQAQRAELAHASRVSAVGALTATIAHEINQPLGAIVGNAEAAEMMLEKDARDIEHLPAILGDIRREGQRAADVIRRVRSLLAKAPLITEPVRMEEVVRDVLALAGPDAARRGIALDAEIDPGLPFVNGDRVHLQQVVLNLALNGMESLGQSSAGPRTVSVRLAHHGPDGGIVLSVSDTGSGITPDLVPRLFESFFTTKRDGMGLGLSIVRSIVEAHGGRITAENNPGPGATFRVILPGVGSPGDPARG